MHVPGDQKQIRSRHSREELLYELEDLLSACLWFENIKDLELIESIIQQIGRTGEYTENEKLALLAVETQKKTITRAEEIFQGWTQIFQIEFLRLREDMKKSHASRFLVSSIHKSHEFNIFPQKKLESVWIIGELILLNSDNALIEGAISVYKNSTERDDRADALFVELLCQNKDLFLEHADLLSLPEHILQDPAIMGDLLSMISSIPDLSGRVFLDEIENSIQCTYEFFSTDPHPLNGYVRVLMEQEEVSKRTY